MAGVGAMGLMSGGITAGPHRGLEGKWGERVGMTLRESVMASVTAGMKVCMTAPGPGGPGMAEEAGEARERK